jgi:hypothetical protein
MGYIVACDQMPGRQGTISLDGLRRQYTKTFLVITSEPFVGTLEVALADLGGLRRVPRVGEPYVEDLFYDYGALVRDVQPRQSDPDAPTLWTVEVRYESKSADPNKQQSGGDGNPQSTNPFLQPPKVIWGLERVPETFDKTADSPPKDVANSAHTPYDPPLMTDRGRRTLKITRNEPTFRVWRFDDYIDHTNIDSFQLSDPGECLCRDITGEFSFSDGIPFWSVTYDFAFDDHWFREVLDKGPAHLGPIFDPYGALIVPRAVIYPKTGTGEPIPEFKLDGHGLRLADGQSPVYLKHRRFPSARFADLKLPLVA